MWIYRESLPVTCLGNTYSKQCFILCIPINNKKGYVVSLNGSPSQTPDGFFMCNFWVQTVAIPPIHKTSKVTNENCQYSQFFMSNVLCQTVPKSSF